MNTDELNALITDAFSPAFAAISIDHRDEMITVTADDLRFVAEVGSDDDSLIFRCAGVAAVVVELEA